MNAKGQTWNENMWIVHKVQWKEPELTTLISEVGGGTNTKSKVTFADFRKVTFDLAREETVAVDLSVRFG